MPRFSRFGKWIPVLLAIAGLYGLIQFTLLQEILIPEKLTSLLRELGIAGPFALLGLMTLAVVVSPIPSFSLDLAAGAALTKMSLKAFALATFVGMTSPTFALIYLGSAIVTVQWPLILAGGLLVVIFLLLPKWMMNHRMSWWVCVL